MTLKKTAALVVVALAGASLLTGGCGGSGGLGLEDPEVILLNGSADPGALAFFFNDEQKGTNLTYRQTSPPISIPFISTADGAYDVSVEEPDRSVMYDLQAHLFDVESTAIVAALGQKNPAPGEEEKRLRLLFFSPERTPPIGNRVRLFILHGFNRKEGFDTPDVIFQTFGDDPQFQSVPIPYAAFTVMEVDSGRYRTNTDPQLDNHWIAKDADADGVYADNPDVTLKPGGLYLVLITGVEDQNPNVRQRIAFVEVPPKNP